MIKLTYNHPEKGRKVIYIPDRWAIYFDEHTTGCNLEIDTGSKVISESTTQSKQELEKMIDEALK